MSRGTEEALIQLSKMVEEKIKRRGEMKHENFGCLLWRKNVLV